MSDPRTIRAALAAFALMFGGIAGMGVFLGFSLAVAAVAGLLLGLLSGGMLLGVARRAEGLAPTDEGSDG